MLWKCFVDADHLVDGEAKIGKVVFCFTFQFKKGAGPRDHLHENYAGFRRDFISL